MSSKGLMSFDKVSNLRRELEAVEREHIGNPPPGVLAVRNEAITQLGEVARSRWQLGRILRIYKTFYKDQHGWVAAARVIGEAIGRDERTIYRIVGDYERTENIPPILVEELEKQGIDPSARKNASLVNELEQTPAPASSKEAARVVDKAVAKQKAHRKASRDATAKKSPEEFSRQIIALFKKRYAGMPPEEAQAEMRKVFLKVVEGLGLEIVAPRMSAPKPPKSTKVA